jgi:hypothetical protein
VVLVVDFELDSKLSWVEEIQRDKEKLVVALVRQEVTRGGGAMVRLTVAAGFLQCAFFFS